MPNPVCCIFEFAPHYRASIFKKMDREILCDFYFGDHLSNPVKAMEYCELMGFKKILKNRWFWNNFYWQYGAIRLAFKPYKKYIISGSPFCISTWLILFLLKIQRKKAFLWSHGWYGDETILKRILKKIFFNLSSRIFLYGDYARNLMIKEGFAPYKLVCIYNSLDYDIQLAQRKCLTKTQIFTNHFGNNYPVLIYIGRIQKIKKLDLLLLAVKKLHKKSYMCNVVLVGDNTDEQGLEALVIDYNLKDFVWFYGPCYEETKISELIYNADLCVSPGNVGLTAVHCLGYGTPVVTHGERKDQMPEFEVIKAGVTGDFFNVNDVSSLEETIQKWLITNPTKNEKMVNNCFTIVDSRYNPYKQIQIISNSLNKS